MQREQLVAGKCLYNLKTGENYKILYLDWPENVIYAVELGKTIAGRRASGISATILS